MNAKIWLAVMICALFSAGAPAGSTLDPADDRRQVEAILASHDRLQPGLQQYMNSVADDVVLLPNGSRAIEGKPAYRRHVEEFYGAGTLHIRHEVVEVHSFSDVVIVRGRAVGDFTAPGQTTVNFFETKNLFVFRRTPAGELRVWRIIFNDSPREAPGSGG